MRLTTAALAAVVLCAGCGAITDAAAETYAKLKPDAQKAFLKAYAARRAHPERSESSGWVDWNMLLDSRGGPNHVGNYCFALLHASDDGQLVFTPGYAYMGHFSRWIRPGARRVSAAASRSTLQTVAFRNNDGRLAVVDMNRADQPQRYRLVVDRMEWAVDTPAHAIQTVVR